MTDKAGNHPKGDGRKFNILNGFALNAAALNQLRASATSPVPENSQVFIQAMNSELPATLTYNVRID